MHFDINFGEKKSVDTIISRLKEAHHEMDELYRNLEARSGDKMLRDRLTRKLPKIEELLLFFGQIQGDK